MRLSKTVMIVVKLTVLDGGLAFADGGEATIDLGANLYSFRRR